MLTQKKALSMLSKKICAAVFVAACSCAILPSYAAEPNPKQQETSPLSATIDRVSLNSANAEQLANALKGIGLKKAEAIIAWREANGRFSRIEQLLEIKGIGTALLEKNAKRIML